MYLFIIIFDILDCNAASSDKDRGICTIGKVTQRANNTVTDQSQDINEKMTTFMFKETVENHANGKT